MIEVRIGEMGKGRGATTFRAEVPSYTRPEVKEAKVLIGGIEHYEGVDGKQYRADLFDKMFTVIKTKVLKRGKNSVSGRTEVILDQF